MTPPGDDAAPAPPAHVHGRRRAPAHDRHDRRGMVTRLPFVVALTVALAAAVVADGERGGTSGDAASATPTRPDAAMPVSAAADARSSTWYCAAGTAEQDGMADHTVTILNPTGGALTATLTVFAGNMAPVAPADPEADSTDADAPTATPAPVTHQVGLPAGEQVALRLGDLVEAPLAAALVEVDGGDVAVEHRVAGEHGADTAPCSTFASPTWHVAWGATTRDARDVVVLFNPFPSSATVDAVFTTEDGGREPVRFQGFPVPAGGVVGVDLGTDVTRSEHVSATFEARSGSIVVEHLQEYDGSLGTRGLSLTPGVAAAGETWVFADGEASARAPTTPAPDAGTDDAASDAESDDESDDAAGEDDAADDEVITTERIVVYNPGRERAEVDVSVIPTTDEPAPPPQPFRLSVGPGGYEVVDYGDQDRVAAGVPHATVVRSTNGQPVVAEQVTVDQGPVPPTRRSRREEPPARPTEVTATTGSRLAAPVWRFPSLADPDDDESTVTFVVYNPDPTTVAEARLDLVTSAAAGATEERADEDDVDPTAPVEVPPGARVAIELAADQAAGARAAIVTADGPVVVDRVVRLGDGRRRAHRAGVPAAGGAVALDRLAAAGPLGGLSPE